MFSRIWKRLRLTAAAEPADPASAELTRRVAALLAEFRPRVQADGGDLELVAVKNGVVRVRLKGACVGCPGAVFTLQLGLERYLRERLPQVVAVEQA